MTAIIQLLLICLILLMPDQSWASAKAKRRSGAAKSTPAAKQKTSTKAVVKDTAKDQAHQPPLDAGGADSDLSKLGAVLRESNGVLTVLEVVPGSPAADMGLKPMDLLTHLERRPAASRTDAASAAAGLAPETRLSAVVIRGLSVLRLTGGEPSLETPLERLPAEVSALERVLKEGRLVSVSAEADDKFSKLSYTFHVAAKQSVWVRFPKGLPATASPGDIILAETTTPVPSDTDLDFFSLPPKSQLWAVVSEAKGPPETSNIRLFFFKVKPAGSSTYPCSAKVTDISGDQRLAKVSSGGTLVVARGTVLDPDIRAKIELLEPLVLTAPSSYFATGPGFWIKSRGNSFEITQVIAGRSAAKAGIAPGDQLTTINGKHAESFDFATAMGLLYGERGTSVAVGIRPVDGTKHKIMSLTRGVLHKEDRVEPIPFPFERYKDKTEEAPAKPRIKPKKK